MTFAAQLAAFATKAGTRLDDGTRLTVTDVAGRVIMELSPVGDPTLWKRSPPASYAPGNFRGNWFYGLNTPDLGTRDGVGITELNALSNMPTKPAGLKHTISNSVPYAGRIEKGHSSQAPVGILSVISYEMPGIAEASFRKVAA